MAFSMNAVPASVRKQVENVRLAPTSWARPYLIGGFSQKAQQRAIPRLETRACFMPLPQESEDARITGGTRSLDRRLLGLNLGGSLTRRALIA